MAMYIGQSRYSVNFVNGGNVEQAVANLIKGNITEISNSKVVDIRQGFFQSCTSLTSVNFPECTTIGSNAFYCCTSLTSADFFKCTTMGDSAFQSCTSLTSANFLNCTEIPSCAFEGCTSLMSINLPKCVTIGNNAFSACESLSMADFPNCITIGDNAFRCADAIMSTNTYPQMALQTLSFPKCTSIGKNAFYSCQMESVYFPECTTVGAYAFESCLAMSIIDLPKCTEVGYSAFYACWHLKSVNLPACSKLDDLAFRACYKLSSINLPACTSIGNSVFYNCSALATIDLPSLNIVPSNAFAGIASLESINLPNCTSVGNTAFQNCTSLESINLPNCTSVGSSAFRCCSSLSEATFNSLAYIGSRAFSSCSSLTNLTNSFSSVASLYHNSAFYGTPMKASTYTGSYGSIFVPASLVSLYKAATNWAYYADRITAMDGIEQIDDITIGQNLTKSIEVPLIRFESVPKNVLVSSNSNHIIVSNIQATSENITFDVTSNDTIENVECNIELTYDETQYTMTFGINVVSPIDTESMIKSIGCAKTVKTTLPYYGSPNISNISVTSIDDSKLSVSNIQLTENTITFDMTSYDIEEIVSVTISVTYGGRTYSETSSIIITQVPTYAVESLESATYGFALNSEGYYESGNKGVSSSYAICKVNIDAPIDCTMYVDCINYAEANYDYGILSDLDSTLSLSSSADSSYKKSFKGSSSATVQTISYDVKEGEHFFYVKYIKDGSQDNNNDSLQFVIRFE